MRNTKKRAHASDERLQDMMPWCYLPLKANHRLGTCACKKTTTTTWKQKTPQNYHVGDCASFTPGDKQAHCYPFIHSSIHPAYTGSCVAVDNTEPERPWSSHHCFTQHVWHTNTFRAHIKYYLQVIVTVKRHQCWADIWSLFCMCRILPNVEALKKKVKQC